LTLASPPPPPLLPPVVRALIFDLDGTLVDSYAAIAESLNHARSRFALGPLDEATVRRCVGRGLEVLVAELLGPDRVEQGVALFRERYAEVYAARTSALPGVARTLRGLRERGYRMAVASNKPARFSNAILQQLDLHAPFGWVAGPDLVGSAKPEPAMLRSCLERLDTRAVHAVYVGDMVLDVETAGRAGVAVALVPGGSSSLAELQATGQHVLERFEDLLRLLPARAPV
jgi:phosphoglycolate phosphatase